MIETIPIALEPIQSQFIEPKLSSELKSNIFRHGLTRFDKASQRVIHTPYGDELLQFMSQAVTTVRFMGKDQIPSPDKSRETRNAYWVKAMAQVASIDLVHSLGGDEEMFDRVVSVFEEIGAESINKFDEFIDPSGHVLTDKFSDKAKYNQTKNQIGTVVINAQRKLIDALFPGNEITDAKITQLKLKSNIFDIAEIIRSDLSLAEEIPAKLADLIHAQLRNKKTYDYYKDQLLNGEIPPLPISAGGMPALTDEERKIQRALIAAAQYGWLTIQWPEFQVEQALKGGTSQRMDAKQLGQNFKPLTIMIGDRVDTHLEKRRKGQRTVAGISLSAITPQSAIDKLERSYMENGIADATWAIYPDWMQIYPRLKNPIKK